MSRKWVALNSRRPWRQARACPCECKNCCLCPPRWFIHRIDAAAGRSYSSRLIGESNSVQSTQTSMRKLVRDITSCVMAELIGYRPLQQTKVAYIQGRPEGNQQQTVHS